MRNIPFRAGLLLLAALILPSGAKAQQSWKTMLAGARMPGVPWAMAVDSQRVVRDSAGSYTVTLRWRAAAESATAPRTDRIETRRLDCRSRFFLQLSRQSVNVRGGKDSVATERAGNDTAWASFDSDPLEGEFLDGVCSWIAKRRPGG